MESLAVLLAFILSLAVGLVVARTALAVVLFLMMRLAAPRDVVPAASTGTSLDLEAAA
jgi:hypothetical protein